MTTILLLILIATTFAGLVAWARRDTFSAPHPHPFR